MAGGSIQFYEAAAQIIPLLVLVVVVEQRSGQMIGSPLTNLFFFLFTIAVAMTGEMVALHELYRGRAAPKDQYWVAIPIGILALALVAPVIATSLRTIGADRGTRKTAIAWICVLTSAYAISAIAVAATRF